MIRLLTLLALVAAAAPLASAQSCGSALSTAEASYRTGDFDRTIERLTACLESNSFNADQRRQAYRLIGLSYVGKDRESDARAAVRSLLAVAPDYRPDPALDPPPFVRIVDEERRNRSRSANTIGAPRTGGSFEGAIRLIGRSYSDSDSDSESGGGLDLALGYAVTPKVSVRLRLGGSGGDVLTLGTSSLGARLAFGNGGSLTPFVGAGATFHSAKFDLLNGANTYAGGGGEVEGGIQYSVSRSMAIEAGLGVAVASLSADGRPDSITSTTVVFGLGLAIRP